MTLSEMAAQYLEAGRELRLRAKALRAELREGQTGETGRLLLRRRITMLSEMARDAMATGRYLANYYGGRETNGDTKLDERDGVSEPERLRPGAGRG